MAALITVVIYKSKSIVELCLAQHVPQRQKLEEISREKDAFSKTHRRALQIVKSELTLFVF